MAYSTVSYHDWTTKYVSEVHNPKISIQDVRDIAAFLRASNSDYVAILRCRGFCDHNLKYEMPDHLTKPKLLRDVPLSDIPPLYCIHLLHGPTPNMVNRLSYQDSSAKTPGAACIIT